MIGKKKEKGTLKKLIRERLLKRLQLGMIKEVQKLHDSGISYKKLESFGLEYRYGAQFLQKKISKEEMIKELLKAIYDYVKRQMTWFKKDKRIHWVENPREAEKLTNTFIK